MSSITVCTPCLLLGGTEISTLTMVQALSNAGHKVTVCCYYESDPRMVKRFEAYAEVDLLKLTRGKLIGLMVDLRSYFRSQRPDVVHVQYMAPGLVPVIAAWLAGVPHVFATVHAAGGKGYGGKAKALLTLASKLTDHFFCVSNNAERFWFGKVSDIGSNHERREYKHSTLHNGVELPELPATTEITAIREDKGVPDDALVVGITGRIVPLKGHDVLLNAISQLAHDNVQVFVVGEGPEESALKQLSEDLGSHDNIIWAGRVEPEDMPGYYQAMDIFVMPSRWEGFGLTVAEAMANGLPAIGTRVPGLEEVIVDNETGLLVPVDDPDALAMAIQTLIDDPDLRKRLGQAGRKRVEEHFAVGTIETQWQEAYRELCELCPQ